MFYGQVLATLQDSNKYYIIRPDAKHDLNNNNNKPQIFPTHPFYPLCLEPMVSVLAEEQ